MTEAIITGRLVYYLKSCFYLILVIQKLFDKNKILV